MKNIFKISIWFIGISAVLTLLGFVEKQQKQIICKGVEIAIDRSKDNDFIEEQDIKTMILHSDGDLMNQTIYNIDIKHIEDMLNNHPSIAKTEVYTTVDGLVKIDIKERVPVIRIFERNNDSYYLDTEGNRMPLSNKFTSRVLIANGYIDNNNSLKNDLYTLAMYIHSNAFWKAQITQIYINKKKEIELIPRVGNHNILLGDINNMNRKFKKLMIFYKKGLNKTGWNDYSTINLKFHNQIICTKK